jgi:hypothetical protein
LSKWKKKGRKEDHGKDGPDNVEESNHSQKCTPGNKKLACSSQKLEGMENDVLEAKVQNRM